MSELEVQEPHHQRCKTSMMSPLGDVGVRGPGASTINAVKTSMAGPLSGAGAGGPRAPTINVVKTLMVGSPWAVPELEIRERPPSTL
jgi:mannose/fructose/N-acetylgalactosamine-specific phosphotransferase system component IID